MPKSNKDIKEKVKKGKIIYLDYSASATPNPSSVHLLGVKTKNELERARAKVADIFHARPEEIIFTSGGTESNNLAIQGVVWSIFEMHAYSPAGELLCSTRHPAQGISKITRPHLPHIITTNIEHPSVLETYKMLEKRRLAKISIVPVEQNGIIDPNKIKKEIKENTVLVSVMYANNEIGTIQPIKEIAKVIRFYKKETKRTNIFFHTDAVQAVNYLDMNVESLGVDLLSVSGSKIIGADRVGVLYKKKSVKLEPLFGGGDQERGLRPGTENLQGILKFTKALEEIQKIKEKENARLLKLRDYFFEKLSNMSKVNFDGSKTGVVFNGDLVNRLPNNINITIPKIPSDLIVIELSSYGIMASSKSACKSSNEEGSYVIKALRPELAKEIGGVRFSLGQDTTKNDIDHTILSLTKIINKLKKWYFL